MPEARQHTIHWWNLSCQPEALVEGSQKVNEKLKQVQYDKNFGTICKVLDAKYVSDAHIKHLFPYSPIILFTSKKAAFTLAEVLITLGIIGIVAAMTIPTLISNYKSKEYSTRLKKFYSTMSQAVQLSTVENGPVSSWQMPINHIGTAEELETFWNVYFVPYLKTSSAKSTLYTPDYDSDTSQDVYRVYFNDGSSVDLKSSGAIDMRYDVNGDSSPNEYGKDIFAFLLYSDGRFTPYVYESMLEDDSEEYTKDLNDRDNVLKICSMDGNINKMFCSQLLFLDNWEFKDDYPYKL